MSTIAKAKYPSDSNDPFRVILFQIDLEKQEYALYDRMKNLFCLVEPPHIKIATTQPYQERNENYLKKYLLPYESFFTR